MNVIAVCCVLAALNVFRNADCVLDDGLGFPRGWSLYHDGAQTVRCAAVSNGVFEISASESRNGYFRQYPVALKAGAPYRFTAEVQCDLPADAAFAMQINNHWWAKSITVKVPQTTNGQWRRLAWEGPMIESRDEADYSIGFLARGGSAAPARLRVRNLRLEPLDAAGEAATRPIAETEMVTHVARIVPISPLLSQVDSARAKILFYWPGTCDEGLGACTLVGRLDGRAAKAPLGEDGRATLDFGAVGPGVKKLAVEIVGPKGARLAQNAYSVKVTRNVAAEGPKGRRLNNFVTELFNGPLVDGELRFFRPDDGFVWISFTDSTGGREATAHGYLDRFADALVKFDADEPYTETMRFLRAGWHTLRVTNAGKGSRVRIHAVKRLGMSLWGVDLPYGGPCRLDERDLLPDQKITYTTPFMRQYVLPGVNMVTAGPRHLADPDGPLVSFLLKRGMMLTAGAEFHFLARNLDRAYCRRQLQEGMWSKGWNINVDELVISGKRANHVHVSETLWEMYDQAPGQEVSLFYADGQSSAFDDPKVHASELAAMANTGYGTGICFPELYMRVTPDPAALDKFIDHTAELVQSAESVVPVMKGRVYMHIAPYVGLGHWTSALTPEVDIKQQYGYLAYRFATDPRLEGVAGLGGGPTGFCEEELIRWMGRLYRYYGVEGGTDDLAAKMGYRRFPGLVRNPDFDSGLEGWTHESGVVRPFADSRLGRMIESRQWEGKPFGNNAAEFVTQAGAPSRLVQKLTGLEPGRPYAVLFALVNADAIAQPQAERPPRAFRAGLEGATEAEELRFCSTYRKKCNLDGKSKDANVFVNTYRYVFTASSSEATLVLEDRDDAGAAPPVGTRQVVNYVVVRPYYCETPGQLTEIGSLLAGEKQAEPAVCRISVDFTKTNGTVHAVHGIGQGPARGVDFSLFAHLKKAGIPYARLHDVGGWLGGGLFVDIPNLFPNFDADETKPENYAFAHTDAYLKALVENDVEPYFRLGVTIENWVRNGLPAKRICPPKDFAKWARICEHVIRHYTEGWADGYRWKIRYWEIWNEPDDFPARNCMWLGTWRQFCELYDVTARHLKECFPHLMIGGYGKCSAHNVTFQLGGERQYEPRNEGEAWDPKSGEGDVPEAEQYIHRAFLEFLDYARTHKTPIDFFSFHGYIGPDLVRPHTDYHRALLDRAGYGQSELHLNEWSSGFNFRQPNDPRAFTRQAAVLVEMQNAGIAVGNIYDGRIAPNSYSPLFDALTLKQTKALSVFGMFNVLYRLGESVPVDVSGDFNVPPEKRPDGVSPIAVYLAKVPGTVRALAARKGENAAVFLVNPTDRPCRLEADFGGWKVNRVRMTDASREDEDVAFPAVLPALSVLLVELRGQSRF